MFETYKSRILALRYRCLEKQIFSTCRHIIIYFFMLYVKHTVTDPAITYRHGLLWLQAWNSLIYKRCPIHFNVRIQLTCTQKHIQTLRSLLWMIQPARSGANYQKAPRTPDRGSDWEPLIVFIQIYNTLLLLCDSYGLSHSKNTFIE